MLERGTTLHQEVAGAVSGQSQILEKFHDSVVSKLLEESSTLPEDVNDNLQPRATVAREVE